jgi:hypothetical protein
VKGSVDTRIAKAQATNKKVLSSTNYANILRLPSQEELESCDPNDKIPASVPKKIKSIKNINIGVTKSKNIKRLAQELISFS